MRFNLRFTFIVFCCLITISANAQSAADMGTIKGKILHKTNQKPIFETFVSILDADVNVKTDSLGIFTIDSLPTGTYTLIVNHLDYESKIISDIHVLPGKINFQEIVLQEYINPSKSVEIKTFRYENNRSAPISSFSFSREEINLNPGSQGDIFRAIGMLPGVSSSGGIYSAISVRGQGVRDNIYMVDDIPLTEVGHLEGNSFFNDPNGGRFSIFAPRVIDHAQFQGGGFSSEYGRRSASYLGLSIKEGNQVNAVVDGQVDLLGITVNYDGPSKVFKNTNLFVSGRYQNFYGLVNLIGLKDIGLPIYGDFILKTTTQINAKNKLSFLAIVGPESFVRDIDNVYADKKLNLLYLPDFKRNKIVLGLNHLSLIGKNSQLKNVLYYTSYTSDVVVGKAYPEIDSLGNLKKANIDYISSIQTQKYSEEKLGYRTIFNVAMKKNQNLTVGFEMDVLTLKNQRNFSKNDTNFVYRASDLMNPNQKFQVIFPEFVNATFNSSNLNVSGYSNYSFLVGQRLSFNAGIRYDYTGFCEQHVISPRLNGSYFINQKNSLNFGVGIYHQDPVYSDIADQPKDRRLEMEKVLQYILSYRRNIRNDLKFTVEVWYKSFANMVTSPITGNVLKNNNGSGWGKGLDINITKRLLKKFHGQISYSLMDIKRNDGDGLGEYDFAFSQPHQFNIMLSHKTNNHWTFSMRYRFATGKPKDNYLIHSNVTNGSGSLRYSKEIIGRNELRLPNFSSLDLRANYNFKFKKSSMTIFMDIVNVVNKQIANAESFNYLSGQNYFDGLAIFPTGGMKFEF